MEEQKCLLADTCPNYDPKKPPCNQPLGGNTCNYLEKRLEKDN